MKYLKTAVAWFAFGVLFVLWSEHCYNQGAAAAGEECAAEASYEPPDPGAHVDV